MLHSMWQQIWKTQPWPQDWKISVLIPISKKGNAKGWSNWSTVVALISRASKVVLKILQARSIVCEQRTSRCSSWISKRQRNQRSHCQYPLDHRKRKRVPEKHLLLLHWLCYSICVDHKKLWKILKKMGKPEHLSCLLKNHHAGQETTVRARDGTTDWFHISKEVHQGCMFLHCLFNSNAE